MSEQRYQERQDFYPERQDFSREFHPNYSRPQQQTSPQPRASVFMLNPQHDMSFNDEWAIDYVKFLNSVKTIAQIPRGLWVLKQQLENDLRNNGHVI